MTILIVYIIISFGLQQLVENSKAFNAWCDKIENNVIIAIFLILALPAYIWQWNWDSENNKIKYPERGIKINNQ
jgi:fumarate reductase subunit C